MGNHSDTATGLASLQEVLLQLLGQLELAGRALLVVVQRLCRIARHHQLPPLLGVAADKET